MRDHLKRDATRVWVPTPESGTRHTEGCHTLISVHKMAAFGPMVACMASVMAP
jgi:hypothetical protein